MPEVLPEAERLEMHAFGKTPLTSLYREVQAVEENPHTGASNLIGLVADI
jgi:hypothetical protein